MIEPYYRHEGDDKKTEVFSGTLVREHDRLDLSSAVEIKSWMRKNGGDPEQVDMHVDLETSRFRTPPIDVSVVGDHYEFRLEIMWPDGKFETVPNTGPFTIDIAELPDIEARRPAPPTRPSIESPAAFLRRMAPTQTHEGRRAFFAAADELDEGQYMW